MKLESSGLGQQCFELWLDELSVMSPQATVDDAQVEVIDAARNLSLGIDNQLSMSVNVAVLSVMAATIDNGSCDQSIDA